MSANKLDEAAAAARGQAKTAFEDYRQRMWAGAFPYPLPRPAAAAPVVTPSLVENIGTLLRLGVAFLNAGLRTGTELLGGVAGAPHPMHPMGGPEFGGDCCCGGGHDHGHHCMYGGHCCDSCHPGVHNCG